MPPNTSGSAAITIPLDLHHIFALPTLRTVKPLPDPGYIEQPDLKRISDMPDPPPYDTSEAALIIRVVQSGVILDRGYVWADAAELQNWVVEALTSRLNHLLARDVRASTVASTGSAASDLKLPSLLSSKGVLPPGLKVLIKWCKQDRQKDIHFRCTDAYVNRLQHFKYRELSTHDILTLIVEVEKRLMGQPLVNIAQWTSAPLQIDKTTMTPPVPPSMAFDDRKNSPLKIGLISNSVEHASSQQLQPSSSISLSDKPSGANQYQDPTKRKMDSADRNKISRQKTNDDQSPIAAYDTIPIDPRLLDGSYLVANSYVAEQTRN